MKRSKASPPNGPVTTELTSRVLRQNAILAGLDDGDVARVIAEGSVVHLAVRDQIYEPNEPIHHVYFPIDSVLSVVARMKDGHMIEVGTVGREGTSAIPLLLGAETSANESYCQVPGSAIKLDATLFKSLHGEPFRKSLDRFVQAYVNMLGQLAACNRLHNVYERCARWLLMTHDRVGAPQIPLTHEYLAMMLGTQRSGVTIAVATLQNAGLIESRRGIITILDRPNLEEASCECYAVAYEQFSGLLRASTEIPEVAQTPAASRNGKRVRK